ncbi:MAG: DUF4349 domain-containing protein [Planctomycetaceae bacterium]
MSPAKSFPLLSTDKSLTERKLIHHATIAIEVTDWGDAVMEVESLTAECGGFIASFRLGGYSRSTRQGQWTLRVPVMQYRPLVNALIQIGEVQEQQETTDEVHRSSLIWRLASVTSSRRNKEFSTT